MKTIIAILASFCLLLGDAAASEAVDAELFPAEFFVTHREALGITEAQLQAIGDVMRQAQPVFQEAKRQLDEAAGTLQKILRNDRPDEDQTDEKMRAVLDCEGEIKMLQLHTLLAVRAQLGVEQIGKARQLRDQLMARAAAETSQRERVDKKLADLRNAIKTRFGDREVPPEIVARARGIYQKLVEAKDAAAEREIDELLGQIGDGKTKP